MVEREAPLSVCWQVTSACNYNCGFCYRFKNRRTLDLPAALGVLRKLADAGVKKVTWSGGEPTLWKPIFNLVRAGRQRGVVTSLITNGSLIRMDDIESLSNSLDWITLSLDGPDEKTNVVMGRSSGHYRHTLDLIDAFAHAGVRVKLNTVISSLNSANALELAHLVKELRVSRWKIFQFYGVRDDAKRNSSVYELHAATFAGLSSALREIAQRDDLTIDVASNADLEGNYFTIVPDGDVYVSLAGRDERLGNLVEDAVCDIFMDKRFDRHSELRRHAWLLGQA